MNKPATSRVTINNPCYLKWKDLAKTKNSQIRHCSACSVNIIDFTQMSNQEILNYLSEHNQEKVCCKMYVVDEHARMAKLQRKMMDWRERIHCSVKNRYAKTVLLTLLAFLIQSTACMGDPFVEPPICSYEWVPDTNTADPSDSTYVQVCEDF